MRSAEEQLAWVRRVATENDPGSPDRRGSLRYIDDAARLRAASAVRTGSTVSLSRPLVEGDGYEVTVSHGGPVGSPVSTAAFDQVSVECHGLTRTHIDGLNHFAYDDVLYSGWAIDDPDGPTPYDWYEQGIFTRALHADVAKVRGTPWCSADDPLSGDDLEAAIAGLGTSCLPGDAVLIDMGRHRFEAAGHRPRSQLTAPEGYRQPGFGPGAAEWIVDHKVSVVCWDFLDAVYPGLSHFSGHALIWAVGQVFVDNCTYARLENLPWPDASIGALVVAPLAAPRTTGGLVNPLFLR